MGSAERPARGCAQALVEAVTARPPTLADGRLLCLDGPAGSGKTTLAGEVAMLTGAPVVHMDAVYAGWAGLDHLTDVLDPLLLPLGRGEAGRYRRYDWHAGRFAEWVHVPPAPLLVLEGVGSGLAAYADLVTLLAWLDAPVGQRKERALARDGDDFAPHWDAWAEAEARHFDRDRTRARADIVIAT